MTFRPFAVAAAALALAPATASARPSDFPNDHSFIVNAARANLAEIAAGKLALPARATTPPCAPTPAR